MQKILDKLIDSLNNGNILGGVIIVAVALIFNYKKIIEFMEERKKTKVAKFAEALNCKHITGLTKSHLEEALATEQFWLTTGVRAEKQFREAILKAHQDTNGELRFVHFKRAQPHFTFKDAKIEVKITTFENVGFWLNFSIGISMCLLGLIVFGILLFSLIPFSDIKNVPSLPGSLSLGSLSLVAGVFMLLETLPVISARYVARELAKSKDRNNDDDKPKKYPY